MTQDLLFYIVSENITESWVLEGSSKAIHTSPPCGASVLLRVGSFPHSSSHLSPTEAETLQVRTSSHVLTGPPGDSGAQ